jgi:hypothetical protein
MSDSIYGQRPRTITSAPWSSAPRTCAATLHTSSTIAAAHDARLLAILDAPLGLGEPAYVGFARKERELGEAFGSLPILDQRALQTRLSSARSGDVLAEKFNRLTQDRRQRLLNFLGDARRRAALTNGKAK